MAVVVEQTIPFSQIALDLDNGATRWNTLFPLIRPSVKCFHTAKGQDILVDTSRSQGQHFWHIVAVGNAGNLSSKLLDDNHVTAIVTEKPNASILTALDLPHALESAGIDLGNGAVMVRAGKARGVQVHSSHFIEVEANGELEADHILHLLGTANASVRGNAHDLVEMCKAWARDTKTARSTFHVEKADGNPSVLHADGRKGFKKAKEAVERDLASVLGEVQADAVYSVHFSDVNGLSRLENYIIAGEIAKLLESKSIPHTLSHSTVLQHSDHSRGFGISICPLSSRYISAFPSPPEHQPSSRSASKASLPPAKISFDDAQIRHRIQSGCDAVIAAEPTITEYDTIVGDGDCGYTLRDGAKKVLDFISDKDLSDLPRVLTDLVAELEVNMGGTSGALYCIFLTALATSLATSGSVPDALKGALDELCKYTKARVGDRTMMDALIPFVESLREGPEKAVARANQGIEGTKRMEAKLGRSTYLDDSATRGVPDPGAYGLGVLLGGIVKG